MKIGKAEIFNIDCMEYMRTLSDSSVDSVVTDPPYELGFMGKSWDNSGIAYNVQMWKEVLRVLKPGGHLLAFSGSRTYHRMTCAIEDAGFEIRDQIMWIYASGFPKSLNVSKAIDKAAGARGCDGKGFNVAGVGESNGGSRFRSDSPDYVKPQGVTEAAKRWQGWGTALKPAHEPICVARKPLSKGLTVSANVLAHGTGALNIDGCRVETEDTWGTTTGGANDSIGTFKTSERTTYQHEGGRWPANFIHDGLTEEWARFFYCAKTSKKDRNEGLDSLPDGYMARGNQAQSELKKGNIDLGGKTGFDTVKVVKNSHPTVKPTDLMRYLCRLVTPTKGLVLDPFMGSGSTGKAAILEGFGFIGVDQSKEYFDIAHSRIMRAHESYNCQK